MLFLNRNLPTVLNAFNRAKEWIRVNTIDGGIAHSSMLRKPYPEVTGYYIPSLLNWGEMELARNYGDWLLSIQTPEGAWQELELKTIYTFDTGQVLKGLYALIQFDKKYEEAFIKGCNWLLKQIDQSGRISTPTISHFSTMGNEYIHLYALEPLKLAAKQYNRENYIDGVNRALNYYLSRKDLTDFSILTHFHAYIVEALIDLGKQDLALASLQHLQKKYQRSNGAIPALPNVRWICLTALMQYAVCYYKLGMLDDGNKLLEYAISKQNTSGGFYGGSGWFVSYFKNIEISWPIKYLLDALHLKLKLEFAKNERAEQFLRIIDKQDERILYLLSVLENINTSGNSIKLIDIGCGKGRFIYPLINQNKLQIDITAMDISSTLFGYLPEKCEKLVGGICQIPKQNNIFDVVFCCEVLEHALNIEAAIKEMIRICKSGGYIIIIDKDLSRKKMKLEAWEQWFDKNSLLNLMEKNDLLVETKELTTMDGPPIRVWSGKKLSNSYA